jgi:hypothetical protein
MTGTMSSDALKEAIREELPALLRDDPQLRAFIADLMQDRYADRRATDNRFDEVLDELRRDREEQSRKWDEQREQWADQKRQWADQATHWEAHSAEHKSWGERWDAQLAELKADRIENRRHFERIERNIEAIVKRHDRSIGALGARWGLKSEATFRNALAGVLEDHFGVDVMRVDEYDDEGVVFGRPDQVELDVIIKNGLLIIAELKSSIDKAGMYVFERKARFFERRHNRKATRLMVISPMIDPRARKVAEELGIELFSDSLDVESLESSDD